jgi:2-keto-4-pentenoate hydratase
MKSVALLVVSGLLAGCVPGSEHGKWSDQIFTAGEELEPIAPLTAVRDITVDEAYRIQGVYNTRMQNKFGRPVGYKVAYASRASQQKWNISAPTFGTFFEKQHVPDGGSVKAENFILFHNEAEVAFLIAKDISQPMGSVEELMPYLASVHVGLDVPDNRFDKSRGAVKVADVIAMSCATHTYVIGAGVDPDIVDFANMKLTMEHNGKEVYSGAASNVLGDPREAVLILVKHLLSQGSCLKKGDVVLSGSVAGAYCPDTMDGRRGLYIGKATGLPPVRLVVE